MKCPPNASWLGRKILQPGPIVQNWNKYVFGNGVNTFCRFDNWHPPDPFIHRYADRVVFNMGRTGRSLNARVVPL